MLNLAARWWRMRVTWRWRIAWMGTCSWTCWRRPRSPRTSGSRQGIAALAARAGDVAEFWTEYSLPDSWRAGNSSLRMSCTARMSRTG